jgi:glycoprotein endo-alpha-1,2-mannosidase
MKATTVVNRISFGGTKQKKNANCPHKFVDMVHQTTMPVMFKLFVFLSIAAFASACDDDRNGSFPATDGVLRSCVWLAARPSEMATLCLPSDASGAYDVCEETCGKCVDDCTEDSRAKFEVDGAIRDCGWLSLRNSMQDLLCVEGTLPYTIKATSPKPTASPTSLPTPKPTGRPTPVPTRLPTSSPASKQATSAPADYGVYCDDERYTQFYVADIGQWQRCIWLAARRGYIDTLCSPNDLSGAYDICAETCGKCTDSCTENSNAKFDVDGSIRDCAWLSLRFEWQDKLCYPGSTAFSLCPETCNACDGKMPSAITPAPTPVQTTPSPTLAATQNPNKVTVGTYYYPWHGKDFHKGAPYLRRELSPKQRPLLGEYDDTDPAVIAQHLQWSRQANIELWVTSWWGPRSREDNTTLNIILPHQDLGSHKIALFYETTGRIKEPDYSTVRLATDIVYMCQNYFSHPSYYKIDDRPVLFMYVTRKYSQLGLLEGILLLIRSTAAEYGFNPYIIGDEVFQKAPTGSYAPFTQLDAVTNYDVRGGMNLPFGTNYAQQSGVNNYYAEQAKWKAAANKQGCAYVPPAAPGYNDRSIRLAVGKAALSRRLTADDNEGSLFRAALRGARNLTDTRTNKLMMINSFNEWHEDSQIEPTVGGNKTISPFNLTQGVEYEAYGELYLTISRQETA